ncbi:hypothetical protein ACTXT7_006442 [Hymenolepis weldensis]
MATNECQILSKTSSSEKLCRKIMKTKIKSLAGLHREVDILDPMDLKSYLPKVISSISDRTTNWLWQLQMDSKRIFNEQCHRLFDNENGLRTHWPVDHHKHNDDFPTSELFCLADGCYKNYVKERWA